MAAGALRLFDSGTLSVRDFVPSRAGHVGVYLCGPTVQGAPHVGHLRSAIAFDQLWRWLEIGHGMAVTMVRNVTDLDDKILAASRASGVPWWAWAYQHERAFARAYQTLGVRDPTYEPRATGHVADMIEFIDRLIERGHAYRALDGSGDVYFDVPSWADYGSLTAQHDGVASTEGATKSHAKRDPRDFVLWKSAKSANLTEQAGQGTGQETGRRGLAEAIWRSPYGTGRPGWHLGCSAMILRYLGETLDIHGGGLDLRFPHHENEQAQSHAAGFGFARYWLHNGWVTAKGEKIGKSLGNAVTVDALLQSVRPIELRYYLGSAHYRSSLELDLPALLAAAGAVRRIEEFVARASGTRPDIGHGGMVPSAFRNALNDDLNVPAALAVLHEAVHRGNEALSKRADAQAQDALHSVVAMTNVLGINPHEDPWVNARDASQRAERALDALASDAIEKRAHARQAGDFAGADMIRDTLLRAGIVVADTAEGTTWRLVTEPPTPS